MGRLDQKSKFGGRLHLGASCSICGALVSYQQCSEEDVDNDIVWKFMNNGQYSVASAYELHFHGLVYSNMDFIMWKAWAPPKVKQHAWIALQNRLWTAYRLQKRGWPNCGLCPLCKQVTETTDHLFVSCQFTIRILELLKDLLGLQGFHLRQWAELNIKDWL
jgi:hypothetical protein